MEYLYTITIYFFIYCVFGWIAEVLYCRFVLGKWLNRGFLNGPYLPIYGFGGLIVAIFLAPFTHNPILIFILAFILTSILEYATSYIMEKIFAAKWWDYSDLPFNINGRVCLLNSTLFGILGLFLTYTIHPKVQEFVSMIPISALEYIFFTIFSVLIVDLMATLNTILNLKSNLKYIHELRNKIKEKTNSRLENSEIIKGLEELKFEFIHKKNVLKNRLINAFPTMQIPNFSEDFEELKVNISEYKRNIIAKKNNKKKKR